MRSPAEHAPVVVVDSDDESRTFIVSCLERVNLRNPVVGVGDAEEAQVLLVAEGFRPALVVLDLHLETQSGLEILRALRAAPHSVGVPVVMLTRSEQEKEIEEAFNLGVFAYLVKPVGFTALREVVTQMGLPWTLLVAGEKAEELETG